MPLHLLGKKSWHVYNSANVERVKRDEAAAKAQEEAEEQRLQQEDAAARLGILRGDPVVEPAHATLREGEQDIRPTKRRRLRGEDDTDRDIRWAREDAEVGNQVKRTLDKRRHDDRPLHDADGHIQLVSVPDKSSLSGEKNAEVETEKARRKQQDEDQYTMRFSNAAGYKNGLSAPWYADRKSREPASKDMPGKDVWGNEDPRRREREQKRMTSSDPLAFMQHAQRQLKQSERDRTRWKQDQDARMRELKREQRSSHHLDDLPPLDLDGNTERKHRHRSHHRHRRRSRSPRPERSKRVSSSN